MPDDANKKIITLLTILTICNLDEKNASLLRREWNSKELDSIDKWMRGAIKDLLVNLKS